MANHSTFESRLLLLLALSPPYPQARWITLHKPSATVKDCLPALELRSTAPRAAQLDSTGCQVVGLGGFEPPTSRLSGVRSNQTEL